MCYIVMSISPSTYTLMFIKLIDDLHIFKTIQRVCRFCSTLMELTRQPPLHGELRSRDTAAVSSDSMQTHNALSDTSFMGINEHAVIFRCWWWWEGGWVIGMLCP